MTRYSDKNPNSFRRKRKPLRLREYDYSQAGAYFITICTQERECLFGTIIDGEMTLNDAGRMVEIVWNQIPIFYTGVKIDKFQIMPNHFHGILFIIGANRSGFPDQGNIDYKGQCQPKYNSLSIPDIVKRFKSLTTKRYTDGVKQHCWTPFLGRLWQRNYYEHVVRNDGDLNLIREYIVDNPLKWHMDRENPNGKSNAGFAAGVKNNRCLGLPPRCADTEDEPWRV